MRSFISIVTIAALAGSSFAAKPRHSKQKTAADTSSYARQESPYTPPVSLDPTAGGGSANYDKIQEAKAEAEMPEAYSIYGSNLKQKAKLPAAEKEPAQGKGHASHKSHAGHKKEKPSYEKPTSDIAHGDSNHSQLTSPSESLPSATGQGHAEHKAHSSHNKHPEETRSSPHKKGHTGHSKSHTKHTSKPSEEADYDAIGKGDYSPYATGPYDEGLPVPSGKGSAEAGEISYPSIPSSEGSKGYSEPSPLETLSPSNGQGNGKDVPSYSEVVPGNSKPYTEPSYESSTPAASGKGNANGNAYRSKPYSSKGTGSSKKSRSKPSGTNDESSPAGKGNAKSNEETSYEAIPAISGEGSTKPNTESSYGEAASSGNGKSGPKDDEIPNGDADPASGKGSAKSYNEPSSEVTMPISNDKGSGNSYGESPYKETAPAAEGNGSAQPESGASYGEASPAEPSSTSPYDETSPAANGKGSASTLTSPPSEDAAGNIKAYGEAPADETIPAADGKGSASADASQAIPPVDNYPGNQVSSCGGDLLDTFPAAGAGEAQPEPAVACPLTKTATNPEKIVDPVSGGGNAEPATADVASTESTCNSSTTTAPALGAGEANPEGYSACPLSKKPDTPEKVVDPADGMGKAAPQEPSLPKAKKYAKFYKP